MRTRASTSIAALLRVVEPTRAGGLDSQRLSSRAISVHHREARMAVGVQLDFKGATLEQYDAIIQKMGFRPGGPGAPGGMFHWVTKTDDGVRVTDVWGSRDTFERFAQEKIGPISQEVGLPNPPEIQFFEVHNYLTAAS
jgi:hypothetical protein